MERPSPEPAEIYTLGHDTTVLGVLAGRTAEVEAAFFLPHLRAGMRVLDVGCGGGSLTLGLARAVAPGEVVGVDREPTVVDEARQLAATQDVANVRFEVGDVYALPFPDASFDAALAHAVLIHLREPVAALREMRRVLKLGGVVGVREGDWGTRVFAPPEAAAVIEEAIALYHRVWRHNGGNPTVARQHRALLRAAGFPRTEGSGATLTPRESPGAGAGATVGTTAETHAFAELVAQLVEAPTFAERVRELGWADDTILTRLTAGCRAWGGHPDAFSTMVICHALGWAEKSAGPDAR